MSIPDPKVTAPRVELVVTRTDDPQVLKEAATEDYSLHVAPPTWRSSRLSLSMAWFSLVSAMFYLIIAGTITLAVGTVNSLIGIALSVVTYSLINIVLARHAARTGLTVALFSRALFGYLGASLATLIFAATAIYYAVFEGSVIAVAFHQYFGGLPLKLWYLVVVAYSVPLVFGGVRLWLDKLNGFLLPFYWIGLTAAVIWAIVEYDYANDWLSFEPAKAVAVAGPGWWFAFTSYMGVWVLMMYTWDFARFGRREDERFHGHVTFGWVFYTLTFLVNGLVGIFLAQSIPTGGALSETSAVQGLVSLMGIFGVGLVLVSQTRINTANFYLASTNAESFFARVFHIQLPRRAWVVVVGAVVYLMMLTDVFTYILRALSWQGVFVVGWVAIALTHIALDRRDRVHPEEVEFRPGRVRYFAIPGLTAWLVSAALGITLTETTDTFGPTWAPPITFVIAAVIYAALRTLTGRRSGELFRPEDPRTEVDDVWDARIKCATCQKSYVAQEMDRNPARPGHPPICADCGGSNTAFQRAAHAAATSR